MKVKMYSRDGKEQGEIEVADAIFGAEVNEHLLYEVIKSLRANQRQGTSKTKTRAEVSGGGKKPWRAQILLRCGCEAARRMDQNRVTIFRTFPRRCGKVL
jgi:ribosomal protein L4